MPLTKQAPFVPLRLCAAKKKNRSLELGERRMIFQCHLAFIKMAMMILIRVRPFGRQYNICLLKIAVSSCSSSSSNVERTVREITQLQKRTFYDLVLEKHWTTFIHFFVFFFFLFKLAASQPHTREKKDALGIWAASFLSNILPKNPPLGFFTGKFPIPAAQTLRPNSRLARVWEGVGNGR